MNTDNHLEDAVFPPGYCLDPNGVICAPAGAAPHYEFGYTVGYRQAMSINMRAIAACIAAERSRWESPVRAMVAAHDESFRSVGEMMNKKGITKLSIPVDARADIAAIAALRALVGPNVEANRRIAALQLPYGA